MRFRPRFTLRALFIAITLFALWLGWEVHVVQLRKDWAARIQTAGGGIVWAEAECPLNPYTNIPRPQAVFWLRRWLGDRSGWSMHVIISDPSDAAKIKAELSPIKSVFPEASILATGKESGTRFDPAWVREITNPQSIFWAGF